MNEAILVRKVPTAKLAGTPSKYFCPDKITSIADKFIRSSKDRLQIIDQVELINYPGSSNLIYSRLTDLIRYLIVDLNRLRVVDLIRTSKLDLIRKKLKTSRS